jgi:hypothetical protein
MIIVTALVLSTGPATAQQGEASTVTTEVPQQQPYPECREINKGGPIAGIVVASVFWWLLPMSIPVWITQTKKLRKRRAEISEQQRRGCP